MTRPYVRTRLSVYIGIALHLFLPCWILIELSSHAVGPVNFAVPAVVLLPFLLIGRWDLIGYGLQYVFLLALLVVAYRHGGWLWPLLCAMFLVALWFYFRRIRNRPALEFEFPLRGGTFYVAHGGSSRLVNYHGISSRSQRFAVDIVKLHRWGTRAAGIYPSRLAAYAVFGQVVYSPCAGVVTNAIHDLPDLKPGEMDRKNAAGNCVLIRAEGTDVHVLLAHLLQGSVLVKAGDHLSAGQPLAQVGNSGNSSEPHLHIHAQHARQPETASEWDGVPMRFRGRWLVRNDLVRGEL